MEPTREEEVLRELERLTEEAQLRQIDGISGPIAARPTPDNEPTRITGTRPFSQWAFHPAEATVTFTHPSPRVVRGDNLNGKRHLSPDERRSRHKPKKDRKLTESFDVKELIDMVI